MEKKTKVALTTIIVVILAATIVAFLNQSLGGTSEGAKIYVDPPTVIEEARQPHSHSTFT